MDFYILEKNYVSELRKIDKTVGEVEYGKDKLKFHTGVILKVNKIDYYVPVSSPKKKHKKMQDSIDFIKIHDTTTGKLLCVLNLNNMIPVPENCKTLLKFGNLDQYRTFANQSEKNDYVFLLQKELAVINIKSNKITKNATKLYSLYFSYPNSPIAKRCCKFELLENIYQKWNKTQDN